MCSPERVSSCVKWDIEKDVEVNIDIVRDDDSWDDKGKHRSSKSRKPGSGEQADELDGSGRRSSTYEKFESRKRVVGSSRADSDWDGYEARKESRLKQVKKNPEESTLANLSTWYQDGEAENKLEGGDKSGSRGYSVAEESERKISTLKYSVAVEEVAERDSRYSERTGSSREKVFGCPEHVRNSQSRWDEIDNTSKADEFVEKTDVISGKSSYPELESESTREKTDNLESGSSDIKSRGLDSMNDRGIKSHDSEERRVDSERTNRGRPGALEEGNNGSLMREYISSEKRPEEHRQPRHPTREIVDSHGRSSNENEDVNMWTGDKTTRDMDSSNRTRTPEKISGRQFELDNYETAYERSSTFRRKEQGKDGSWDDRPNVRDDSWSDRNRDRDNFNDNWRRRQDKETGDGNRDWELHRRDREWIDGDRLHGRFGGRKDGSRTGAVKTSSKYGISNENYDVIEIQTKPFDYGREESRSIELIQQSDTKLTPDVDEFAPKEERSRITLGSMQSGEDTKISMDDGLLVQDQHSWRDDNDFQAEKSRGQKGLMPNPDGIQEPGSFSRTPSQGIMGNRFGRVGRGRTTRRDGQTAAVPIPLVGLPFGPLGLPPPGSIPLLTNNMSPAPLPPSPGVFIPPFQPPIVWPPVPPGPLGPRFSSNLGTPQSGSLVNPSGPGRGMPLGMSGPNFNAFVPMVRGQTQDKSSGGWFPPRTNAPPGKAPSRGEQNDYSQNFVDTGTRPQNFIRELELTSVVEDYPRLRELIQRKDEIVVKSAFPPMYHKCDLREQVLTPEFFGTKFDVILVDPPWEEYVHRAPGVTDHMDYWTLEEIMNLKIEAITDTPSFIFLWVGDGVGLEQGRQCLKKWGFRRCEDICWVKTNKSTATPGLRHDSHTLFQRSKEHCLMGIKGTVRRSTDGHIIHANIDTDVIIAEEPPYGSTAKPEDMYRIIEHFALGRRRLELFGEDHNIRSGWLTVGKGLSSSNFESEAYIKNFADKDGKVWMGGRNPPPETPHLVLTTPEIESLRPKSPMKNQQHQSASISLMTANSSNRRPPGNPSQSNNASDLFLETSSSNIPSPAPWMGTSDDRMFGMYAYNASFGPGTGDFLDYESNRGMNML
ncbi:hypothetical protein BUALT_Bualt06G0024400 [Buddleja alternifolia]|uniref:Methyltransferase-like protein 1 n=1 Tax=Buddleja alternifolia TaxID=168488 RepID=A0AAV6XKI7_9LAMI|nr:hypothetical protein BUALT_Bualt06G0024400 [Buddleja alternifolia]